MVAMEMTKTFFELSKNEILNGIGERYIITHYDGWELVYFDKTSEKKQVIRLVKND